MMLRRRVLNSDLRLLLSINELLSSITDIHSERCANFVINELGLSQSEILKHIVNAASSVVLTGTLSAIKAYKINTKNNKQQDVEEKDDDDDDDGIDEEMNDVEMAEDTDIISSFECIPDDLMGNINHFLTRKDIKKFKRCSRRMGRVCLQRMDNILIQYILTNNLLNTIINDNPYYILKCHQRVMIAPKNKKYVDLYKYFYETPKSMSIFNWNEGMNSLSPHNISKFAETCIVHNTHRNLMIFDKSQIDDVLCKDPNDLNNKIMLLSYFDICSQTTKWLKFIMIHPNTTKQQLLRYMEEAMCDNNLSQILHTMDSADDKFIFYHNYSMDCLELTAQNIYDRTSFIITAQLNIKHPSISSLPRFNWHKNEKFISQKQIKNWCNDSATFYEQCISSRDIIIIYQSDSVSLEASLNALITSKYADDDTMNEKLDALGLNIKEYTKGKHMNVAENALDIDLRKSIASDLQIVNYKQIELTFNGEQHDLVRVPWDALLPKNALIFSFVISLYDIQRYHQMEDGEECILRVTFHDEIPTPLWIDGDSMTDVNIKYNKSFTVRQLVEDLKKTMNYRLYRIIYEKILNLMNANISPVLSVDNMLFMDGDQVQIPPNIDYETPINIEIYLCDLIESKADCVKVVFCKYTNDRNKQQAVDEYIGFPVYYENVTNDTTIQNVVDYCDHDVIPLIGNTQIITNNNAEYVRPAQRANYRLKTANQCETSKILMALKKPPKFCNYKYIQFKPIGECAKQIY